MTLPAPQGDEPVDEPRVELAAPIGASPAAPLAPAWPRADPAVRAALEAAWLDGAWGSYHGPYGPRLQRLMAARLGVEHVLLCSSGTLAVELALRGLGVGPGDEVVIAGYDFPGNFRAIEAVGARPALVDITPDNWTLAPEAVAAALAGGARAIIASHLHGGLADMPTLCALAAQQGALVVEDACQAPGATIAGQQAGAWGDVGVFSFGGSKLLTAGRGGAIVTRDAAVFQRAKIYGDRGNQAFPLPELSAAILIPQWERLDADNARRAVAVATLLETLGRDTPLAPARNQVSPASPSYYKLGFRWAPESAAESTAEPGQEPAGECAESIERFLVEAQGLGIGVDRGFRGFVHRGPRRARRVGALENSRRAAATTLVLHHPVLLEPVERIEATARQLRRAALGAHG